MQKLVRLVDIVRQFPGKEVVVIGDAMLDEYVHGQVSRISPEAPIPILKAGKKVHILGGAGNVAANISSLGGKCSLFGFIGDDEAGKIVRSLAEEQRITCYFGANSRTTLKVRGMCGKNHVSRTDYEDISKKFFTAEEKELLRASLEKAEIIVVSDYGKGAVTSDLMEILKDYRAKTIAAPKPENRDIYRQSGLRLFILNREEALKMSEKQEVGHAAVYLRDVLNSEILITLGAKGMALFPPGILVPTCAKEEYDVTGAGDTVLAAAALALSCDARSERAAILGNYAAGIAVSKPGTYAVKLSELEQALKTPETR